MSNHFLVTSHSVQAQQHLFQVAYEVSRTCPFEFLESYSLLKELLSPVLVLQFTHLSTASIELCELSSPRLFALPLEQFSQAEDLMPH